MTKNHVPRIVSSIINGKYRVFSLESSELNRHQILLKFNQLHSNQHSFIILLNHQLNTTSLRRIKHWLTLISVLEMSLSLFIRIITSLL